MKKSELVFNFIIYMFVSLGLVISGPFKYLISGSSKLIKALIVAVLIGLGAGIYFKPVIIFIVAGIAVILCAAFSIFMMHYDSGNDHGYGKEKCKDYCFIFFNGMNLEEAKREYRKLMKMYHPDNVGGDPEMAKKISEEYSRFCAMHKAGGI